MKGGPQTWEPEEEPVSVDCACISLDGTRIAAVFADETLCVYDTTTGEAILSRFKVDEIPWTVILSRDGNLIGSAGRTLRFWNVLTGEEVESFDIKVYSLAFSPDGTCIAAGCTGWLRGPGYNTEGDGDGSYNLRVINLELAKMSAHVIPSGGEGMTLLKGEVQHSPFEGHKNDVNSVAYSPDGKQIASSSDDCTVRVWDVSTGERRTFRANINSIGCLAFSPDGTQIAADIGLLNLSTGSFIPHAFDTRDLLAASHSFSADGRLLTLGTINKACYIWDASIHQSILRLIGHSDDVRSVAFFPDGKQIMTSSWDGTIRVWEVELLEEGREMDEWEMEADSGEYWVLGPKKEHLFWTPLLFRHTRNTLVIGKCLDIDFSNFVHGDEWVKCQEPLENKETTSAQGMEVIGGEE